MATNERLVDAPTEDVFELVANPNAWPDDFSRIEYDPGHRVVFEAKRPLGTSRVELEVFAQSNGTCVRMVEQPVGGLLKPLNNRVFELITYERNERALDHIAHLAESQLSASR